MEIVKDVAAVVGCILSCMSLLTIFVKPLRRGIGAWFTKFADKTETTKALDDIKKELGEIRAQMAQNTSERRQQITDLRDQVNAIIEFDKKNHEALKDMIRERIVSTYYANLEKKSLHYEEWETVSELGESYFQLGGNHFVKGLLRQMSEWDILR